MENYLGEDVNELCRLCLAKDEQMIPIYDDDDAVPLPLRIMACVDLEVYQQDGLPAMICPPCKYQLDKFYQFKNKCKATSVKLRKHFELIDTLSDPKSQDKENDRPEDPSDYEKSSSINKDADDDDLNGLSINITEDELIQGYIPGSNAETPEAEIPEELQHLIENAERDNRVLMFELSGTDSSDMKLQPMKNPMMTANTEIKVFKCDQCPMAFTRRIMLKSHQSNHSSERGATCSACNKWFPTKSALTRHERTHTGEKPFPCNICHRAFAQKEILVRHLMTHSGIKPYKCLDCDKSFTQRAALQVHTRTHQKLNPDDIVMHHCQLCEKAFCHASGLSRHLITHTGKKYQCTQCEKSFTDKSSLLRHARIHGSVE